VLRHRLLIPFFVLVLALGLAACGGGGGSDNGDAEGEIETVIESSATSTDPASCAEYSTMLFMEQTTGQEGKEAEQACEESVEEGGNPEGVTVTNVEVDGEEATADAEFEGGNFGGQSLSVGLVEEEGEWKLNEFTGFANFDAAKLTETLVEQLEEQEGVEPEVITCISEGLEELDEKEFEEMVIENNSQPFVELAEGCEG
jgi:ABC-type glycerol-3-phosphate transport system substrate-binding protein